MGESVTVPLARGLLYRVPAFEGRAKVAPEAVMHFLVFLLFGLVVGALARLLVPGKEPGGWIVSLAIGVAGAFAGGLIGRAMGFYREGEPAGFIMSLLGAILLVIAYQATTRRRIRF
jgi:uncharacterized membrane protein YeaQ/YmgE (transglycosylase-associated protein family)